MRTALRAWKDGWWFLWVFHNFSICESENLGKSTGEGFHVSYAPFKAMVASGRPVVGYCKLRLAQNQEETCLLTFLCIAKRQHHVFLAFHSFQVTMSAWVAHTHTRLACSNSPSGATSMQRTAVILNLWVVSASVDTRMMSGCWICWVGDVSTLALAIKTMKKTELKAKQSAAHHANHFLSLTSLLCTWLGLDSCGLDLIPGEVYKTLCYARCKWKEYELQSVWQMRKSGCRRRWGLKWH